MPETFCSKVKKCQNKPSSFSVDQSDNEVLLLVRDEMLLLMHQTLFSHYGYKVATINQPENICDYLKKHRPSLVVFDMKIREGLCQQIAFYLQAQKIPALLIITSGEESRVCKYLEPGLCDYVDSFSDELRLIIKKAKRLMRSQKNTKTLKHRKH